jgi:hypothetical protein
MDTKLAAIALGLTLAFGMAAGEARAASDCSVTIPNFGISVDVCADAVTNSDRRAERDSDRRAERDRETCTCDESSGTCNVDAHNSQGDVEPEGKNTSVSTAVCTRP